MKKITLFFGIFYMISCWVTAYASTKEENRLISSVRNTSLSSFSLIDQKDVKPFLLSLLRTPCIIEHAKKEGSIYYNVIEKLASRSLIIHIPSSDPKLAKVESMNFTSWFQVLTLRSHEYKDPMLADLYLLHEMNHMSTMPYNFPYDSCDHWQEKMIRNEKESTLVSEAYIYFDLPALRQQVPFKHIWVDPYLSEKILLKKGISNFDLFQLDKQEFFDRLLTEFTNIDLKPYAELSDVERRTADYSKNNYLWCAIWSHDAIEVESHMHHFMHNSQESLDDHLLWLQSKCRGQVLFFDNLISFISQAFPEIPIDEIDPLKIDDAFGQSIEKERESLLKNQSESTVTSTPLLSPSIELLRYGISPTVYALPWKESEDLITNAWRSLNYQALYGEPYTRKQDCSHVVFLEAYKKWAKQVVLGLDLYPYSYATNGSSEAIRDTLSYLKAKYPSSKLHMFEGDYEGVFAFAQGLDFPIIKHPRTEDFNLLFQSIDAKDYFYLTQPSSIDGNLWEGYQRFIEYAKLRQVNILLDIAYVGCVAKDYEIDVKESCIAAVFFSLSKSFGVYYQRIGGVFVREENPLLFGNKWFKNVMTQILGTELLSKYTVFDIPRKYLPLQYAALSWIHHYTGLALQPSDVILLGYIPNNHGLSLDLPLDVLTRGAFYRACLTPWMDVRINHASKD